MCSSIFMYVRMFPLDGSGMGCCGALRQIEGFAFLMGAEVCSGFLGHRLQAGRRYVFICMYFCSHICAHVYIYVCIHVCIWSLVAL